MTGHLVDLSFSRNRKQRVTLELDRDFREDFDKLQNDLLDITIKKHRKKRSLSANAYFHVLVGKIAAERGGSEESVKHALVLEYGALAKDADGLTVGFKLPASVDVTTIYPYVKCFDTREENGKLFNCYLVYKQTHLMDSKEMARLIDGAIEEAKELGIAPAGRDAGVAAVRHAGQNGKHNVAGNRSRAEQRCRSGGQRNPAPENAGYPCGVQETESRSEEERNGS